MYNAANDAFVEANGALNTIVSSIMNIANNILFLGRNLSSNQFRGSIPVELGHIINLDTLNLRCNQFNGPIPTEFGNPKSVQTIDMSFNKLSGSIAEEPG